MDVDAVLAELSAKQLAEWRAYYLLEPFGGDWHRTAMLTSVLANSHRNADIKPEPFTTEDFLPQRAQEEDEEEAEPEDIMAEDAPWRAWKAAMQALSDASSQERGAI